MFSSHVSGSTANTAAGGNEVKSKPSSLLSPANG